MGLLDDAIREHLELKRRLGADPTDVERLEREAFGASEAAQPPPAAVQDAPEAAAEPEPAAAEQAPPEPEPERAPEPVAAEPGPVEQPTRQFTLEELEDAENAAPPAREAPAEAEPETADGEHDELEETPDFLQETPEHDRLWFEQKPPKDFDF